MSIEYSLFRNKKELLPGAIPEQESCGPSLAKSGVNLSLNHNIEISGE